MIKAAKLYVENSDGWSSDTEMYFHAYPHGTMHSLHMHIVDVGESEDGKSFDGPSHEFHMKSNIRAEDALEVRSPL